MNRRAVLAGVGALGVSSLAGCVDATGFDEHASNPAGIEPDVLADTGYERTDIDEITTEEEVSYLLFDEEVVVLNYLTEYEKSIDMGPLGTRRTAAFALLTSPQVRLFGREFNPAEEMDTEELIDLVGDNYDNIRNVAHESDDTVTVLGEETARSTFTAEAAFGGFDIDVLVHVTEPVETDDDFLAVIGIHPKHSQREAENALALAGGARGRIPERGDRGATPKADDDSEGTA
jgi:hypothetical protein